MLPAFHGRQMLAHTGDHVRMADVDRTTPAAFRRPT